MGVLAITVTDKESNDIVDSLSISNMVTDVGIETLWKRASMIDELNQFQLDSLHFGDDFGDGRWTIFNPEPATRGFTKNNQNVTHKLNLINFEYPTDEFLKATAFIDGTVFMDDYFPAEVDYRYTSMTLRFKNDDVFAYKRFPIRSISRFVNVTIDWRFKIVNEEEWCKIPDNIPEAKPALPPL